MMTLGEITEEIRELYRSNGWSSYHIKMKVVIRDQLAAKLKAEFERDHPPSPDGATLISTIVYYPKSEEIEYKKPDPRHKYDDSAWKAEAERLLKGD